MRRALVIELGPQWSDARTPTRERTQVQVGCQEGALELLAIDPVSGAASRRTLQLDEAAPATRARLLALAIAELVAASWSEGEATPRVPPPAAAPAPPASTSSRAASTPASQAAATVPSSLRRVRLMAVGGALAYFSGTGVLGGSALRVGRDHARHVGWLAELSAHHGTATVTLGSVDIDVVGAASAFGFVQDWRRVAVRAGAGVRGGGVRLRGRPAQADRASSATVWAPWLGALTRAGIGVAVTRRLTIELGVEAGYVLVPVGGLVDGARAVAIDGAWVGFDLGVGMFL